MIMLTTDEATLPSFVKWQLAHSAHAVPWGEELPFKWFVLCACVQVCEGEALE